MLKIIKHINLVLFITFFFFTTLTCKKSSPVNPDENNKIIFTFEDASCTEAWFNLKINDLQFPVRVDLYKDNFLNKSLNVFGTTDTTFYIEYLLPKKKYEVYVKVKSNNGEELTSERINFETMDTTSHNFTWQSWEFGQHSSSTLYDVAIIDENNIWAVGEIYMLDSLGNPDPNAYNTVHWDGTKWELKRIYTYSKCSSIDYAPLRSIYAFASNKIVVTSGGGMWWFDGNRWIAECSINPLLTGAINKLWGSSSEDLYAVGNNGNIAHWDGRKWTKIESGTYVDINDVFGVIDTTSNNQKVFCAVSFVLQLGEHKILTIDENNKVDSLHWNTGRRVNSIWSNKGRIVYTSGGGVFNNKVGYWVEETEIPLYYTNRIRGNGLNDIFAVGDFALLTHFNGMQWNVYKEFLQIPATSFNSITVKDNIIAIVGYSGDKALIITGKRN
jgi:hypothetical protein